MPSDFIRHPSSYRDPSGFLFYRGNELYRQVNQVFREDFDQFIAGGLYHQLVNEQLIIPHDTINDNYTGLPEWHLTLKPEKLAFVSYPYEWCFNMLKDAALTTLKTAQEAMKYQMMLKDASAYNIQLHQGRMVLIDTLSFEKYDPQKTWIAYRQFCEQFLAPLALMHYLKEPLQHLLLAYPEGIPLSLVRKLLPFRSRFNLHVFLNLNLHASVSGKNKITTPKPFSAQKLTNLLRSLEEAILSFSFDEKGTWGDYYNEASRRADYLEPKKQIIADLIGRIDFGAALDAGANEGEFSELLATRARLVISADFEHYSINHLYQRIKEKQWNTIHPLVVDLANPTPATGFSHEERASFLSRVQTDLVLALALIHHLAIGKNIPFEDIARMFRKITKLLIIEFVPREDEKIRLMLSRKKDVYAWYSKENFLRIFSGYFRIIEEQEVGSSKRIIYLMQGYD